LLSQIYGSGVIATELEKALALRGHEVQFLSYHFLLDLQIYREYFLSKLKQFLPFLSFHFTAFHWQVK
jgi:hypothetical protein